MIKAFNKYLKIHKNSTNYICYHQNKFQNQLDRSFLEIHDASYGDKFADLIGPDGFTRVFYLFCKGGKLIKKGRGANLQVILLKEKVYKYISSEILEKCADRSLVSARPLCPFDDASDEIPFSPGSGN